MEYRGQRLDSWKAIADHLGRDVRTVARWERERGLPVHRVPGRSRTVFAHVEEIELWLASLGNVLPEEDAVRLSARKAPARQIEAAPEPDGVRRQRITAVLLSALVIPTVVWAVWEVRFAPLALATVTSQGRSIVAATMSGSVAWTFTPPPPLGLPSGEGYSDIGDLDGAPGPEVLAAPLGSYEAPDRLYALSNRGDVLWQRTLDGSLTFGGTTHGPPWRSLAVKRFEIDGVPRIAWATHHQVWWPSMLAVLDARRPGGAPPPPPGAAHECKDCPAGSPVRYVVLGRSELAALVDAPLLHEISPPSIAMLPSGGFEVHAMQSPGRTGWPRRSSSSMTI